MGITGYTIFGLGWSLYLLLLWRCLKTEQWRSYPFFFGYVFYTFLRDVVLSALLLLQYGAYAKLYWLSFMGEALLWFVVTWEVLRQTFPRGLGPRRIAAGVLISVLFLLALVFYYSGPQPGAYFIADFVRKIALSVTVWLLVVLALARYYGISVGRNIWGMAVGLLVVVSAHIANFAAVEISPSFSPIWSLLVPLGSTFTLLIWTVTLWSYVPNPRPSVPSEPVQQEALSYWEERWAALGMTIRKAFKP
jgi:hypothetical protein